MKRAQFNFRLPPELMARVDAARGDVTRTEFVEVALEQRLRWLAVDADAAVQREARIARAREIVENPPAPAGWRRRG